MESVFKKLEVAANVAIILVALLLGVVLVKRYLWLPSQNVASAAVAPDSSSGAADKIQLPGLDLSSNKTLVLALSNSCHFCTESASFYRDLAKAQPHVKMIAVLPQSVDDGKKYLNGLGVQVDGVMQAPLNALNVRGTPTLLLVNQDGSVAAKWVGKLPAEDEVRVKAQLKAALTN